MKKVKKVYSAAVGALFTDEKAKIYGREIDQLMKRHGYLRPPVIVAAAHKLDSPLHDHFEWNESKAAHQHRLSEARHLMNHLLVKVVEIDNPIKAFDSVPVQNETGKMEPAYVSFRRVAEEGPFREAVLQRALREGKHWRDRYAEVQQLAKIFTEFDKTFEKHKAA